MLLRRYKRKLVPKKNTHNEPEKKFQIIQYTKTEINRMSTAELQNLSAELGIDNPFSKTGGELKKILIDYFNLNKDWTIWTILQKK